MASPGLVEASRRQQLGIAAVEGIGVEGIGSSYVCWTAAAAVTAAFLLVAVHLLLFHFRRIVNVLAPSLSRAPPSLFQSRWCW